MQNVTRIALGLGAAAVVASGGSAFTASNSVGANVAGFGTNTVSNAATSNIKHNLSTNGQYIESTVLTFSTDLLSSHVVQAGFGTSATNAVLHTCSTSPDYALDTITCTYSPGTSFSTGTVTHFAVAVN